MIQYFDSVHHSWLFLVAVIIMSLYVIQLSQIIRADSVNPQLFGLESSPYRVSNGEWTAKWWKWLISIPESQNPARDETGMNCSLNQDDQNVWFLTGTFGDHAERTCKIPAGKAIFFAHANECSRIEYPMLKTDDELSKCAITGNEIHQDRGGLMEASLDGVILKNLTHYRVLSQPFNLSMPEKNIWGVESGATRASSDAYIIFMRPLPLGNHVFEFKVSVPGTDPQTPGYAYGIKYNLIVQN